MNNDTNTIGEIAGVIQKTQGNQKYLFGTIKSDKVKNVTFVPLLNPVVKLVLMKSWKRVTRDLVH